MFICIAWFNLPAPEGGANHTGSGKRMSGQWFSMENCDRYTKIITYPHNTRRDRVWLALRGLIRGWAWVMMRPTHGCIVLLKGAALPCVGGYEAGIEEQ